MPSGGGLNLSGKKYVLPIAIDDYDAAENGYQPLANPVADTDAIADILKKKFGYKILAKLHNDAATQRDILRTLKNVELKKNDTLIVLFSGHGDLIDDEGQWAAIDSEAEDSITHVSASAVLKQLDRHMEAQHIFLIVDCCFPDQVFKNSFTSKKEPNDKNTARSRSILTSGRNEKVPDGAAGEHSPFAKALIQVLNKTTMPLSSSLLKSKVTRAIRPKGQKPVLEPLPLAAHEQGEFELTPVTHSVELPDGNALRKEFYNLTYPDFWGMKLLMNASLNKLNCFALKGKRYSGHLFAAKKLIDKMNIGEQHFKCFHADVGNTTLASRSLWELLGNRYEMTGDQKSHIAKAVTDEAKDKLFLFFLQIPHNANFPEIEKLIASFWNELQDEMFSIFEQHNKDDSGNLPFKEIVLFVFDKRGTNEDQPYQLIQKHNISKNATPSSIPDFGLQNLETWRTNSSRIPEIGRGTFNTLDFSKFDATKGEFEAETTILKICELCGLKEQDLSPYKLIFEEFNTI